MSLLLDAFKKSRQPKSDSTGGNPHSGFDLDALHVGGSDTDGIKSEAAASELLARNAGRNLFSAKSQPPASSPVRGINRNLLIALGATILLLGVGAAYLWYLGLFDSPPPMRPRLPPPLVVAKPAQQPPEPAAPVLATPEPTEKIAGSASEKTTTPASTSPRKSRPVRKASGASKPSSKSAVSPASVGQKQPESVNDVLANAYRAYRGGNYNESRLLYVSVLDRDRQNVDALLGVGAIAQRQGEDSTAAQYYLQVLEVDPRNAVANAGMSALSRNPNAESLLKGLLREQRDSAALHFALGNIYASQSRWGEAQTAYFNAYSSDSGNVELALNLAISLDHLGQQKMAVQYYQRALELDDNKPSQALDHDQIALRVKELAN